MQWCYALQMVRVALIALLLLPHCRWIAGYDQADSPGLDAPTPEFGIVDSQGADAGALDAVVEGGVSLPDAEPTGTPGQSLTFGGSDSNWIYDVAVDEHGHVYVVARVLGETTVGSFTLPARGTGPELLLLHLDENHQRVWSRRFVGTANVSQMEIEVAPDGRVFLGGSVAGDVAFDGITLTSKGDANTLIVCFDENGTAVWAKNDGITASVATLALALDTRARPTLAGVFVGTLDVEGNMLTSDGGFDIFLVARETGGGLRWAQRAGGPALDGLGHISADPEDDHLYLAGTLGMDGGMFGDVTLQSSGSQDALLARLNPLDGAVVWAKTITDDAVNTAMQIAVDATGLVVAGTFEGAMDFGGVALSAVDSVDTVLARLDKDGNTLWAESMGGRDLDWPRALVTDDQGRIWLGIEFADELRIGTSTLTSAGLDDAAFARFAADGTLVWTQQLSSSAQVLLSAAALAPDSRSYFVTMTTGPATLSGVPLTSTTVNEAHLIELAP